MGASRSSRGERRVNVAPVAASIQPPVDPVLMGVEIAQRHQAIEDSLARTSGTAFVARTVGDVEGSAKLLAQTGALETALGKLKAALPSLAPDILAAYRAARTKMEAERTGQRNQLLGG